MTPTPKIMVSLSFENCFVRRGVREVLGNIPPPASSHYNSIDSQPPLVVTPVTLPTCTQRSIPDVPYVPESKSQPTGHITYTPTPLNLLKGMYLQRGMNWKASPQPLVLERSPITWDNRPWTPVCVEEEDTLTEVRRYNDYPKILSPIPTSPIKPERTAAEYAIPRKRPRMNSEESNSRCMMSREDRAMSLSSFRPPTAAKVTSRLCDKTVTYTRPFEAAGKQQGLTAAAATREHRTRLTSPPAQDPCAKRRSALRAKRPCSTPIIHCPPPSFQIPLLGTLRAPTSENVLYIHGTIVKGSCLQLAAAAKNVLCDSFGTPCEVKSGRSIDAKTLKRKRLVIKKDVVGKVSPDDLVNFTLEMRLDVRILVGCDVECLLIASELRPVEREKHFCCQCLLDVGVKTVAVYVAMDELYCLQHARELRERDRKVSFRFYLPFLLLLVAEYDRIVLKTVNSPHIVRDHLSPDFGRVERWKDSSKRDDWFMIAEKPIACGKNPEVFPSFSVGRLLWLGRRRQAANTEGDHPLIVVKLLRYLYSQFG